MSTGDLIRSARLRRVLFRSDLAERLGLPSSSIARWETDTVEPGFSKLRRVLQGCGFDIPPVLVPFKRDPQREARVQEVRRMTPQERLSGMMKRLEET